MLYPPSCDGPIISFGSEHGHAGEYNQHPRGKASVPKESVDHNCDSSFEYAPPSRPCQIPPESRQFWDLTAAFLLRICNALAESIQYLSRESRSTLAVELGLKAKGK